MKKSLSLLLVFVLLMCACLTACSNGEENDALSEVTSTGETENNDKTDSPDEGDTTAKSEEAEPTKDASGQSEIEGFKSFKGQTLDGEAVDVSVFKNAKLTVVNVWGTFCTPCIEEMPSLGEVADEYKQKDVQFIGIVGDAYNSSLEIDDTTLEDAKSIVKETKANYTHVIPDESLYRELLTNMTAFPTTYFIDSDGNFVGQAVVGALDKGAWEEKIDSVLSSME
ncbi:MAG: TlpA family protein disulfide reductase [Acutalibacteraceae bacterium]